MNRETLDNLIENYNSHDEILISKMALLIEKYPYFQLPRFFYAKSLKDQNKNEKEIKTKRRTEEETRKSKTRTRKNSKRKIRK